MGKKRGCDNNTFFIYRLFINFIILVRSSKSSKIDALLKTVFIYIYHVPILYVTILNLFICLGFLQNIRILAAD